jgi:outer membrane murein-binding lipoprotein Lpp
MADTRSLRGYRVVTLIRECALGVRSEEDLAAEFGVSGPAIHYFKQRNAATIAEQRQNIENELAALWISKLWARLAELQGDVEQINEELDAATDPAERRALRRDKIKILHEAAEQSGQLRPQQINVGTTLRYEIVGVDMDKLA